MEQNKSFLDPRSSVFIRGRSNLLVGGLLILLAGCEVTHESESGTRQRQREALNDPFNYGPRNSELKMPGHDPDEVDPTDITGGDTSNLNKRALKRDWDAVWGND